MAKNRSRRLRKKMHIDEFQELGFSVAAFPGRDQRRADRPDGQRSDRRGDRAEQAGLRRQRLSLWEGLICMQEIGKCTEEHQAIVRKWLEARKLEDVRTSELFDVWWD